MIEEKGFPSHLSEAIKHFLYNHRAAESPYELGVSALGTLVGLADEWDIDNVLSKPDATLRSTGIISFWNDAPNKEFVCIFSSIRLAMYMVEELYDGYHIGQVQGDWTYGLTRVRYGYF